ncbi:MAG: hypothetical protein QGG10_07160, partial [Arenicellales bacterium]|nr:hypothetical protein [Arenicellales bacterium]
MKRLIALSVFLVFGSVAYADYDMSEASKQKYRDWLKTSGAWHSAATDAALAVAPNGCWAAESGVTRSKAKYKALKFCKNYCKSNACKVVDFNGTSAFINIYHPGSSSSSSTASTVRTLQIGGGTYIGDVVDGRANGQGTLTWPNGNKYIGEWKDGKRHGQGTLTLADGDKYVGEFKDNNLHG